MQHEQELIAFDPSTGAEIWSKPLTESQFPHSIYGIWGGLWVPMTPEYRKPTYHLGAVVQEDDEAPKTVSVTIQSYSYSIEGDVDGMQAAAAAAARDQGAGDSDGSHTNTKLLDLALVPRGQVQTEIHVINDIIFVAEGDALGRPGASSWHTGALGCTELTGGLGGSTITTTTLPTLCLDVPPPGVVCVL